MRSLIAAALLAASAHAAPPPVSALAYRPDGSAVAAGTHGKVTVCDSKTGEPVAELTGLPGRVTAVAFAADGRLAVAAGTPGKAGVVRLYDAAYSQKAEFPAHADAVYALAFSPDGATLATGGYDRLVKLWNTSDPKAPRLTLTDHSDTVYAVAFAPDGKLLASAAADRAVKVWDTATGKRLYTLGDPTDWVYALAFRPDGTRLAAAGVDKSVRVWDVSAAGGKLVRAAFAHQGPVVRLAYSPDGGTLYSAGEDRVVKAWDADKLVERKVFAAQPDAILALALRPDGKQLAVGRYDGGAVFLDTASAMSTAFFPPKPRPPAVTKLTPSGATRGTTTRVRIDGARLDTITGVESGLPGVTAKLVPGSASAATVEIAVPADAPVGGLTLTLKSAAGPTTTKLAIDRFAAVVETGTTDSARAGMAVKLPATVAGTIDRAGDGDFYTFEATAGQAVGVQVVAAEIGSKLEAYLSISDATGRVLADSAAGRLGFVAPAAGRYAIGVRDRDYRGGADQPYRLHVGDIPVVTGVFPLAVPRGKSADVHVSGVFLGSPHGQTVRVSVPADAAIGSRVAVPVNGEHVGDATVAVAEFPSVVAADGAELRGVPGSADGILAKPGDAQSVRFHAKKGVPLVIETHARRLGSPADTTIDVLDAAGRPVPRVTLRAVAKTYVSLRDHDSEKPGIRLDTWNELDMNDYLFAGGELMRIKDLPRNPDDDCQFVQAGGKRLAFLGTTPQHHALNAEFFKVEAHPPGATFPPNGLPVFRLPYRNDDGGPAFAKDSFLTFDAPADGVYQVRVSDARGAGGPAHAYRVTVRPPRPDFTISLAPTTPAVWKGGAVPLTITATRADGFDGPIRVTFPKPPAGFAAPDTVIEAGQLAATVTLSATDAAVSGTLTAEGRAAIGSGEVVRAATATPKAMAAGDIVTAVSTQEVTIRPGKEARFTVVVDRRNGFAGRVPVEVLGLPHGVRVLNIGLNGVLLTEKDTKREVAIYAEPWVQPLAIPFVVAAKHEKKKTDHAAPSVMLNVQN